MRVRVDVDSRISNLKYLRENEKIANVFLLFILGLEGYKQKSVRRRSRETALLFFATMEAARLLVPDIQFRCSSVHVISSFFGLLFFINFLAPHLPLRMPTNAKKRS